MAKSIKTTTSHKAKPKMVMDSAEKHKVHERARQQELKAKDGLSYQVRVRDNKNKSLDEVTKGYDRTQYLVAHEINPGSIKKPEIKERLAWVVRDGRPVLERFQYKVDRIKPIIVTVLWKSTRKVRKLSLYGGDTGQLGTVSFEELPYDILKNGFQIWFPDETSGYLGLSPASFTKWDHDGYYIDRRYEFLLKTCMGYKLDKNKNPIPVYDYLPGTLTKSAWVDKSMVRQWDFDTWIKDEVQIDAQWKYGYHIDAMRTTGKAIMGRRIKDIPNTRRDIVNDAPYNTPVIRDENLIMAGKQTVMAWERWGDALIEVRSKPGFRWIKPRTRLVWNGSFPRWTVTDKISRARYAHAKIERETIRKAQIIIPANVVKSYLDKTRGDKMGEVLIRKAITILDDNGCPVMSDTVMALCRLRRDGGVNIRYVQMMLKQMGYEILATALGHGIYGRGKLARSAIAWATPYDEKLAQEYPEALRPTEAELLESYALA